MADEPVVAPPSSSSSFSAASPLASSVISLVNRLQDIFARVGSQSTIDLPQVAVVGSQSSGKSSVLEALVGRDFLPRGNDICTRRPLVLQLVQTKRKPDGSEDEYGEFLHLPGKRFHDFSEIRREIQAETDREAGGNKGVSDKQICLKIFSPNVLDITLVDLPGITKVPVGDQPSDIEARIRTMIMSYIKAATCLILAVTPANSDLANSDALQMAGIADPDVNRTIGVITKLDIMDRGTDAQNLLLGKVIPLRLGYVGVVNRSQEDILMNRSIKDALAAEEKFFRSHPVYSGQADSCGIPQLAKRLNQILAQHIKAVLPALRANISTSLVAVAKEHASYGEITESKAGQGALLLNILSKYCEAFSSMVEGKNEEMSTSELFGGARIHYIFQSVFVRSLEEVDPCEDLTDDDICTAIQNATGPKSALFVPEVPFEVLVRRQISRLLDPSLQCARFIYDELIKISHHCMVTELQRFPFLMKRMDEVIRNFLREGLEPSENMIGHIIEMEMDYINTSHPNFIGGSKALETAVQQTKSSRVSLPVSRVKDALESDKGSVSERSGKSRANGVVADQGVRAASDVEKVVPSGNTGGSSWGISSIFGRGDNRVSVKENTASRPHIEPVHSVVQSFSTIHLREPPPILRPSESNSETEAVEITVTKLLLRSYCDIVRKNVEDLVPKAIMHFLVNNTKRELHNVFIKKLYRDNLFEEMLQEPDEIAMKRKRCRELLRAYQQAFRDLDELPLEAETVERGYSLPETTGLPKINGLPTSSLYSTSSSGDYYAGNRAVDFIPGLSNIRVEDLAQNVLNGGEEETLFARALASMGRALPRAKAVINFFAELDPPPFVQDMRSKLQSMLYIVPLPMSPLPPSDTDATGCFSWLDRQNAKSVAYVSFGTVVTPPPHEIVAMAEALEESGFPFLWSLRDNLKGFLPYGFLERTSMRGKIVLWAPQAQLLAHDSVGVFVTHCGVSSVVESISNGVPMICRPFSGDQGIAARMVQDVWEIGVIIEGGVSRKYGLLNRLNLILVQEEGKKIREKALKVKRILQDTARPEGRAAQNLNTLGEVISSS